MYGRGATDDKGAMLIPILAAEALLAETGKLPVNVRFFFEGQEEIGSPDLPPFIRDNLDRLQADMIFSADGGQWDTDTPQTILALKGLVSLEITVTGRPTPARARIWCARSSGTRARPICDLPA